MADPLGHESNLECLNDETNLTFAPTPVELDVTERVTSLARTLCNDHDAREVAGRAFAPLFDDSDDQVQEYWRTLAVAAFAAANEVAALAPTAGSGQERDRIKEAREWLRSRSRWDEHENRLHYVLSALTATLTAPQGTGSNREAEAALADPAAVHINMLRGAIAKPSVAQIWHIYGEALLDGMPLEFAALTDTGEEPSEAILRRVEASLHGIALLPADAPLSQAKQIAAEARAAMRATQAGDRS